MAAVVPGAGVPVGGSIGSTTYSRNRYGAYQRNRTMPVNPNSPRQARARNIFTAAVAAWQALTPLERTAWENWAALTPWLNSVGETVHLTGQVAFNRHFSAQMNLTYPTVPASGFDVPPLANDVGSIAVTLTDEEIAYDVATGAITFVLAAPAGASNNWAVTGGYAIVEITPGQNATRNFHGSRWSQLFESGENNISGFPWITGDVTVSASANPTTGTMHFPYGLQLGQVCWIRVRGLAPVADRRVTTQLILGPFPVVAPTP